MADFSTTNIASQVGAAGGVPPVNPLQTVGQFAALQNALNQNRLFQAQRAVGQAAQGAINPLTGAYDPMAANQAIAGNPLAAVAAPEALSANQSYATNAQALQAARYGAVRSTIGPLMTAPNIQGADVARSVNLLAQAGVISPDMAATVAGSMPSDPTQLRGYLADTFGLPGLGPTEALNATAPAPAATNLGGTVSPVAPPPQIGAQTLAGPPGAGGVPAVQPSGAATVLPGAKVGVAPTLASVSTGTGTQFVAVDPNAPGGGTATNVGAPIKTNLATGTQIWVPNQSEPGGGHFALTSPTGPVQNQPPLGAVAASNAAASAIGTGSGTAFVGLVQKADAARANLATAEELDQVINNPNYAPGPKAATIQHMGALAQQLGIQLPKDWQQGTANIELAHKLQAVMVSQSLQSFNEGVSDARQALSTSTNVQNEISRLGQQSIMPTIQGISDAALAKQAMGNEWLKTHPTGEGYSNFATQYNAKVDPMIFAYEHMPKPMQRQFTQGMTPAQSAAFNASQKWAIDHGILTP